LIERRDDAETGKTERRGGDRELGHLRFQLTTRGRRSRGRRSRLRARRRRRRCGARARREKTCKTEDGSRAKAEQAGHRVVTPRAGGQWFEQEKSRSGAPVWILGNANGLGRSISFRNVRR